MKFEQLGPYRIGRRLGRGGMGAVYEAVNTTTNQPAAVKVLNPHLADEEGFRSRFDVEIETLKKLKHPHIVRLYGYGEEDGHLYYAMELVPGTNLEDELQAGRRFDWREVTAVAIKLCRALKHAHDHGVIHRDLKPANLLLTVEGDVKLADFGIARLFGNTRMTAEGSLIGTAEYMAPEQADGRPVTPHCDLYSLGAVLYAMLAGRPPFRAASLHQMLEMHRAAEPAAVTRYAANVPLELERIVMRLLSKDPASRAANADLLSRQLSAMEHGLSLPTDAGRSPSRESNGGREIMPDETAGGDPLSDDGEEYDPLAPTRIAEAESAADHSSPRQVSRALTQASQAAVAHAPLADTQRATSPGRFTTVEEDERRRAESARRAELTRMAAQIGVLASSLLLMFAAGWYFLRPPSADRLFERIELAAADAKPERLLDASEDIDSFLERFPDDPRNAQLRNYREEAELLRLERRLQRSSRLLTRDESLDPIQRDYLEAVNYLQIEPQRCIIRLRALVALHDQPGEKSDTTNQWLELARRQLQRLEAQAARQAPAYLDLIDANLARAARLSESDPAAAAAVWRSIVDLYSEKPWAVDRVGQARRALAELQREK